MANVYYEKDADASIIAGRKVAILGYGSQGHAHALNLKDSGVDVRVGLREGSSSAAKASEAGLRVTDVADGDRRGGRGDDAAARHRDRPGLRGRGRTEPEPTATRCSSRTASTSASATSRHPRVSTWRWWPRRGPGHLVRRTYTEGGGVPCLIAVAQDATGGAKALALSYADAIGGTRAGVLETTFEEETETDLFGEQVVLCGGLTALVQAGFETLVDAGYQPESAYFECLHELKLIVDLMYEQGISGMRYSISTTAEYGDLTRGPRIVTDETKAEMRKILGEIRSGEFAEEFIGEVRSGGSNFEALRKQGKDHQVEQVGADAARDDAVDLCRQDQGAGLLRRRLRSHGPGAVHLASLLGPPPCRGAR